MSKKGECLAGLAKALSSVCEMLSLESFAIISADEMIYSGVEEISGMKSLPGLFFVGVFMRTLEINSLLV